jgi:hypothetical protein
MKGEVAQQHQQHHHQQQHHQQKKPNKLKKTKKNLPLSTLNDREEFL